VLCRAFVDCLVNPYRALAFLQLSQSNGNAIRVIRELAPSRGSGELVHPATMPVNLSRICSATEAGCDYAVLTRDVGIRNVGANEAAISWIDVGVQIEMQ
jgi:hypothetical protein